MAESDLETGVDARNRRFYEQPETVEEYAYTSQLFPEEELVFERCADHIRGRRVLDIGCGGGRTTPALLERTTQYTGLDYSSQMVERCRQKWPETDFRHGDASDLSLFGDGEFAFVLFSFNGIDSMSHEKRLRTLREVYRVLEPGGIFAFSTHNRDDRNIVTSIDLRNRSIRYNLRNLRSYLSARKLQERTSTYAILSDPLAGFGYLTYYIRKQDQVRQLEEAGFGDVVVIDQGARIAQPETEDRVSQWCHYVARKPL
jgi:ubiquinone/menaquinone biosynthesis C-methylase UbiE